MNTATETGLHQFLDHWLAALHSRDVEAIAAHYVPDVVAYDAVGALRFTGRAAYAEHWRRCLNACQGTMIFECRPPAIRVAGELAVLHYLCRCGMRKDDGSEEASWMRTTTCLAHTPDGWLIVHEHNSIPFDTETGQCLFGLQP